MIPGGFYPEDHHDYDVEKLREAAGIDENDATLPNYKCPECNCYDHIDDYQRRAPSWCDVCDDMREFIKVRDE